MNEDNKVTYLLPIFRKNMWYESLDYVKTDDHSDTYISICPKVIIAQDYRFFKNNIKKIRVPSKEERIKILAQAVKIFCKDTIRFNEIEESEKQFVEKLGYYVGIPQKLALKWIDVFQDVSEKHLQEASNQSKDDLIDDTINKESIVFVNLPSNTFLCLEQCLPVLLQGKTLWIRPSKREPFSAIRFVESLIKAGWPKEMLGLYYTTRKDMFYLIEICSNAILFGGESLENEIKHTKDIVLNGPGRTCVIVDKKDTVDKVAQWLLNKMADNAGRFCINASKIACIHSGLEIGKELAKLLDKIPLDHNNLECEYPMTQKWKYEEVKRFEHIILTTMQEGDEILTRRQIVVDDGQGKVIPAPTLVLLKNPMDHPLLQVELPFPFATLFSVEEKDIEKVTKYSRFIYKMGDEL